MRVLTAIKIDAILPPVGDFLGVAGAVETPGEKEVWADAERLAAGVAGRLRTADLDAESVVKAGDPRSTIVDEAEEWAADLIVVGSHEHTGITKWLLGSVAQSVVAHAACSVEVVRSREATA